MTDPFFVSSSYNYSLLMELQLPYDKADKISILNYALRLKGRSLRSAIGITDDEAENYHLGKGSFGNRVEEFYFMYSPNSISQPDFPEAGIELKTTPLKRTSKGLVSKERLVFNIINYMEEHKNRFATSSFWSKNKELLLLFYLYEAGQLPIDHIFKIVRLWRFPEEDLKIIIDDWNKIISKIKEGKAHELSEGDTMYLGACTKGATRASVRPQPFSELPAMQRAFSLKSKYLNFIIAQSNTGLEHIINEDEYEYLLSESNLTREEFQQQRISASTDIEPVVRSIHEYRDGQTFEELVIEKFEAYKGYSEKQLIEHFQLNIDPKAKNRFQVISNRIMGVEGRYVEEFVKGDVEMKTIVLDAKGNLKESMSFQQIKYKEIINETWLESYWYETLTKRFFFIVFKKDANSEPRLQKVMFWTMPVNDLDIAERFWLDTQAKILEDEYSKFIQLSDDMICHVRPKAKNAEDLTETISGGMEKKKAYWLNNSYIKNIIS